VLLSSICLAGLISCGNQNKNPNIIFIMADDLGYGDVSCYNPESLIQTPNIDRLAKEGIKFTDAHSPSSVCSPTRYGLLTGRYAWRSWLKKFALNGYTPPMMEKDRETIASLLKKSGYKTGCFGKWHIGLEWKAKEGSDIDFWKPLDWSFEYIKEVSGNVDYTKPVGYGPADFGFDYFFGTSGCSTTDPPYVFIENDKTVGIPSVMLPEDMAGDPGYMVPDWNHKIVDDVFVSKAKEFINENLNDPFFVYISLSAPHAPHLPPDNLKGKSGVSLREDMVLWVDQSVGEIIKTIEQNDLTDNTLIIVTSDNGPLPGGEGHSSSGGLRSYKASIYEGGHRVPFIARWPGKIKSNSSNNETICLTDIIATFADLTETKLSNDMGEDSHNILPLLLGKEFNKPIREALVLHSGDGTFAIRQRNWKFIEYKSENIDSDYGELYNLKNDPAEKNNLFNKYPDMVEKLSKLLKKYKSKRYSRSIL